MGILLFFAAIISLVKVSDRPIQSVNLSNELKKEIQLWEGTEDDLVIKSLEKTAHLLEFSQKNDIKNGKANCVGYAQLCSAICNYAFLAHHVDGHAKPVVGYLKVGGVNLCDLAKAIAPSKKWKNFVKDHDFVEVTINGKTQYIDPSLSEVNLIIYVVLFAMVISFSGLVTLRQRKKCLIYNNKAARQFSMMRL